MRRLSTGLWVLSIAVSAGCVRPSGPAAWGHGASAPVSEGAAGEFAWADLNAEAFARARSEGRIVLIDGSAEWCHWCHVMDATTYSDPEVRKLLGERFLPVKVDIDSRPDFEERYHDWGWPATVLMTADAEEISKFRGYIPPAKFLDVLRAAAAAPAPAPGGATSKATAMQPGPLSEEQVAEAGGRAQRVLDGLWDAREGSWGEPQKVPLYWDNAWALAQARAGSESARKRALFTLEQQRKIIDPVWGGICQYSTDGDWVHPHFEKLTPIQAGAIDNYATAFALTGDAQWLATAQLVRGFVDRFMTGPEGGFYATMDADLNAHDATKPLVSGHDYYEKDDAARRALGIPRVDSHEYGRENGLAIAAYVTLNGLAGHTRFDGHRSGRGAPQRGSWRRTRRASAGSPTAGLDDVRVLYPGRQRCVRLRARAPLRGDPRAALPRERRPNRRVSRARAAGSGWRLLRVHARSHRRGRPGGAAQALRGQRHGHSLPRATLALRRRATPTGARSGVRFAVVGTQEAIDDRGRMVGDMLLAIEETSVPTVSVPRGQWRRAAASRRRVSRRRSRPMRPWSQRQPSRPPGPSRTAHTGSR